MFVDRFVARKHAVLQKVRRLFIDRKLKIAVEKLLRDAFFEAFRELVRVNDLDYTSQFLPRNEPERHALDQSKKTVPADCEPEQFGVFIARTANPFPVRVDQGE